MGEQDVHQGPSGCVGEQDHSAANLAEPPGLLHGKRLERRQYLQATARHTRFKDAALAAQELAAAEEEGETMAMMFTLLQEQHKARLKSMAASNKQVMDMMFERMNVLVVGHGKAADKVTAPPANSNTGHASSS